MLTRLTIVNAGAISACVEMFKLSHHKRASSKLL
jgi:hypothetical protein